MIKTQEPLARVTKYNKNIKELDVLKRIGVDYPILVRETVAKKLSKVARKLPNNILLQVDSGHRTRKVQQLVWEFRYNQIRSLNKDLPASKIYSLARKLVFDPSKGIPPHTTGGAIDVSLAGKRGKEINLSEPLSKYYDEPQLNSKKISKKAQELRLLINKVMLEEGFAPNAKEYWHFSYGDETWAKKYDEGVLYVEIEVPENMYYSTYLRILYRALRHIFRLSNKILRTETNY